MRKANWKTVAVVALTGAVATMFAVTVEPPVAEAGQCYSVPGIALGWGEGATCPQARRDCQAQAEAAAENDCLAHGPDSTYIFNSITFGPCGPGQSERKGRDCRVSYTCIFCPAP